MTTILSGKEFKRLARERGWSLVKYLSSDDFSEPMEKHYNYKYKFGLNEIPPSEVNLDCKNECASGGLYFTYFESYSWIDHYWFRVTVPDYAQVAILRNDKFKTDKLLIQGKMEQSRERCLAMVRVVPGTLKYIEKQTLEICAAAVEVNPYAIQSAKFQDEKMALAAVKRDYTNLEHVIDQTNKVCFAAIDINEDAIKYIRNPTPAMYMRAISKNPWILGQIENQTPEICLYAVRMNGFVLRCVKKKSVRIRSAALWFRLKFWLED